MSILVMFMVGIKFILKGHALFVLHLAEIIRSIRPGKHNTH